jgi:tRNA 2-thiouridine synthesizing protein B
MLHLISESPIDSAVLARLGVGDEVVFLENAVLRLLQTGADNHRLTELLKTHPLYVLADDLTVRGIAVEELVQGIRVINYTDLVSLTVKHPVMQSWS